MKTNYKLLIFLLSVAIVAPLLSFAGPDDPPGGAGGKDIDGISNAPIDGGLSLLLAAGVGYGIKKVRERRKNNTTNWPK